MFPFRKSSGPEFGGVEGTTGVASLTELLREVRRIDVQSRRLVTGLLAGEYRSVFRGSGVEFDEVREYVPGDDPRTVDWNVTARLGRPFVKSFVDERELTVLFVVDRSSSMDGGFGPHSMRGVAARLCACLALSAVRNHDRVGLIGYGQTVGPFVAPGRGLSHALRLVREVLAAPPVAGTEGLTAALRFASRAIRRHAILFVLSDFIEPIDEQVLRACARRHDVIAVQLRPPELAPDRLGLVRVRDPESGIERLIDWNSSKVRTAWRSVVTDWNDALEATLRRARVDRIEVPVPAAGVPLDVAGPLRAFFHMRERRETHA